VPTEAASIRVRHVLSDMRVTMQRVHNLAPNELLPTSLVMYYTATDMWACSKG
jgi:hypothetical protein